ncbi:phage holin family protein [Micropruina sonneratiae]|uniref:phage holin family protein n=1 Tax=Micropruina sonneratiae TaxID=2986940 RepID=UPI00222622F2|nr:phage holin family protein [Micropruina sp. KQZ13P-5]MCW3156474.1 phage holin family protein [Micropruina sp. KQZ13P-5]
MANQNEIADIVKAIQADVTTIVRGEVELAKAELVPQAKSLGIGAGLFGAAGYFGLNGIALLFLGLSALVGHWFATALGWAPLFAAFIGLAIMAVLMFLIAGVLALVGKSKVTVKGPEATVDQGQRSVEAVKGAIERGRTEAEAEAEARKAARKDAPSITAGDQRPSFVAPRG